MFSNSILIEVFKNKILNNILIKYFVIVDNFFQFKSFKDCSNKNRFEVAILVVCFITINNFVIYF